MPFINGFWVEQNKPEQNSIKLTPKDVSLTFIRSNDTNREYKITYAISLFSSIYNFNEPAAIRLIDQKSLKDAIFGAIYEGDRPYVEIDTFNTKTVTFKFLWKKWFNDALNGVIPQTHLSKFEKAFSFKKQLPRMVLHNFSPYSGNFLVNRFKELISERKMHKWFDGFIPKDYQQKINVKIYNMFDYSYDYQFNKMILRLNNIYILGILFAIGERVDKQTPKQPYYKVDFEKKVKNKSTSFDKKKWESFIRQKFF